MTANEMSYEFDVLYDKIASLSSPGYTAKEKSVFLTKAQSIYVDKYNSRENKEKFRRDFDNILRTVDISTSSTAQDTGKPNGTRYDLPADFLYPKSEEVTITHSTACYNNKRIMVVPMTEDRYSIQVKNPFKKPRVNGLADDCAWRMDFYDNTNGVKRVDLITDGVFTISTYHLTYLKKPADIVPVLTGDTSTTVQSDCELNETCHNEIVEMAVRIASGVTNPQEYQIKVNEEQLNN